MANLAPSMVARFVAAALLVAACGSSSSSNPDAPPSSSSSFTLHYHRGDAMYTGWTVQPSAGANETSATAGTPDAFGAVYALTLKGGATSLAFTLQNGASTDKAGTVTIDVSGSVREAWVFSGYPTALTKKPPVLPTASTLVVYYVRPDKTYAGWGLHLWGDQVTETQWLAPLQATTSDPDWGDAFTVPIATGGPAKDCPSGTVCLIVHMGDTKDPGPNMSVDVKKMGNIVFVISGSPDVSTFPGVSTVVTLAGMGAHLVAHDTVAWCLKRGAQGDCIPNADIASAELRFSGTADIAVSEDGKVTGGTVVPLTLRPAGLTADQKTLAPYLAGFAVFDIASVDQTTLGDMAKGQLVAIAKRADGSVAKATKVNTALYLDEAYAYDGPLGVTFGAGGAPTFDVWAPTAQDVKLHVFDAGKQEVTGSPFAMTAKAKGVWEVAGQTGWKSFFYRYELRVYHPATGKIETLTATDPYSVNLSTNGAYSQIVDMTDPALAPPGWAGLVKPPLAAPEDIVIYESHVRDFSAFDSTVAADRRGKYLAFETPSGGQQSDGLKHLAALAQAGLTHIHLLPVFDIATVDEDPANRVDLGSPFSTLCAKNSAVPSALCTQFGAQLISAVLATFAGDSDQQQTIVGFLRGLDSFNWGYDPLHYGAPEGSYASTAEGTQKIVELRRLVKGLNDIGLRVVLDVVYNHTNAAGVADKSVLDKIVPGYYHRLDPDSGAVLTSSCCSNTASEHKMMERLLIDTLVRWARDYKIDGFRFDLMGLHLKQNIVDVQAALAALTLDKDGIDGSSIYLYGEGWDMGEMANNARGVNANQHNMAGTGVGTFNDRLRDGVRGGGPFDGGNALRANQGFTSGLYTNPNELSMADDAAKTKLLVAEDLIKIGMAGNLTSFRLIDSNGNPTTGSAVSYNNFADAAYCKDPQENIIYAAAHDNQDLWDIVQYKLPTGTPTADRARSDELALDVVLLGEGVPFVHMGDDLLRSKSMDGNSYDSGDWFNRIDWSGQTSAWKTGLPQSGDNSGAWTLIKQIYADATAAPRPADIAAASAHFQEMLKIRKSSPLFRLRTAADVMKRVDFQNQGPQGVPGVIVMTIADASCAGTDLDPDRDGIIVVVNADKAQHTMTVPGATGAALHAIQQASADPTVKTASVSGTMLTVPARTTAVFEVPQSGDRSGGPACNTR